MQTSKNSVQEPNLFKCGRKQHHNIYAFAGEGYLGYKIQWRLSENPRVPKYVCTSWMAHELHQFYCKQSSEAYIRTWYIQYRERHIEVTRWTGRNAAYGNNVTTAPGVHSSLRSEVSNMPWLHTDTVPYTKVKIRKHTWKATLIIIRKIDRRQIRHQCAQPIFQILSKQHNVRSR